MIMSIKFKFNMSRAELNSLSVVSNKDIYTRHHSTFITTSLYLERSYSYIIFLNKGYNDLN